MKIPIVLLLLVIKHVVCQFKDHHDMNTNSKEKYMQTTLKKSSSTSYLVNGIDSEILSSNLKKFIGVFINSAHIDKRDPAVYHGNIRFKINPDDLDFLMNFGKEGLVLDELRKLDRIFNTSFKKSFIDEYLDEIESYQLKPYSMIVNKYNLGILGTICLLYVVYQSFRNNFLFSYIIKYFIILILIADFGFRYQCLLEEAEEHNTSIHYSSKCDPAKMTWSKWTKFWFSNEDCERKTVTPLDALLYQVKNLIIIPMHAMGTGLGGFGYNLFTNLPWGLNLIMWPSMLIFVIIIIMLAMVIYVLMEITVVRLIDSFLYRPMAQNINPAVPLAVRDDPN